MFRRGAFLLPILLLVTLYACSGAKKDETQTQNPAPAQQPAAQQPSTQIQPAEPAPKPEAPAAQAGAEKSATRPPAGQRSTTRGAATKKAAPAVGANPESIPPAAAPAAPKQVSEAPAAVVPPPPPPKPIVIPSGTRFEISLVDPINSAENKSGDTFKATLNQDLEADGKVIVPKGSTVAGKLIEVKQSGRVEGRAALSMTLTKITVGEASYPIQTNTLSFEAEKTTKQDATKIGIGAGLGAIIGAIAGGGKGAAIGAAVGGGAGTATVLATKGKEVKFQPEERFSFVLRSDLAIRQ
ncbi:MAG: hypothetical protein LAP85_07195 [Acidobacteriia bacterium]|nr:hypothetical protein [Terriglobia bacterium]